MALQIGDILNAVESHAMASGLFEQVNGHEPTNPPASGGLTAAVWVDQVTSITSSGLDSVSGYVVLNVRIYTLALTEPMDAIDPQLVAAVDELYRAYCGDFTLSGLVRNVDIFGQKGSGLTARAGYVRMDSVDYRVMTITLPLIINDLWEEVA